MPTSMQAVTVKHTGTLMKISGGRGGEELGNYGVASEFMVTV